ncbi:MAG TPA: family 43 glycosylhydrolase, partial [Verrucomicrobiae bacterium]
WPLNVQKELKKPLSPEELQQLGAMSLGGAPRPYYPRQLLFRRDFTEGQMARDMTLFVDDDGRAYHLHAAEDNGTLHISQLSEDFLSPSGNYVRVFPGRFHEAPAIFKRGGKYYLITSDCTGWAPNTARVSVAENIFGPWEELGNPVWGTDTQTASTFSAQSTYILPVQGQRDAFIFMADRWNPKNAIDGRYVWLPIEFHHGVPMMRWHDEWSLGIFDQSK